MRPLAAAVLCAAVVAAAPAQAQTVDDADTVGDMATFTFDKSGKEAVVAAPERSLNDLSSTTLTHGTRRVAIEVDYVDLKKKAGGEYQSLFIILRTNEGARRHVSLDAWRGHWSGETGMYARHHDVRCSVRHSIDYEANVMKVSFPRRCASNPRWVQVRVGAFVQTDDEFFIDDALLDRPLTDDDFRLALSERVVRGAPS